MPTVIKKLDAGAYQLKDQVVAINRVTKVVKGGKNLSFAALVVVGGGRIAEQKGPRGLHVILAANKTAKTETPRAHWPKTASVASRQVSPALARGGRRCKIGV